MLTLDSSAVYALLDAREREHSAVRAALESARPPFVLPAWVLAEVCYLVGRQLGGRTLDALLADVEEYRLTIDCGEDDIPRIRALVGRYADLPLAFADAAVVACAERRGGRVLSLDRDFAVVAREGTIELLP